MRRAALRLLFATAFLVVALAAPAARAQDASVLDASVLDASALNPAEATCIGQSLGSACDSSTTGAGGTCLAGCCCHFVSDPEGSSVCNPCLACSDTAYLDPAYKTGACSDGGTLLPEDSGPMPFSDSGTPVIIGTPGPTASTSGCSCTTSDGDGTSSVVTMLLGLVALGRLGVTRRKRPLSR